MSTRTPYHGFSRLILTVSESSMAGVRTDHSFELRSTGNGAEVWRSSVLHANGDSVHSGERYCGWLGTRKVIELLDEIERSGVYEALPAVGIVAGETDPEADAPLVSMRLESATRKRDLLTEVPNDGAFVNSLVRCVRDAVDLAEEHALSSAG